MQIINPMRWIKNTEHFTPSIAPSMWKRFLDDLPRLIQQCSYLTEPKSMHCFDRLIHRL